MDDKEKDLKYWIEHLKTEKDLEEFNKRMESLSPKFSNIQEKVDYVVSREEISATFLRRIFEIGYPSASNILQEMIDKKSVDETASMNGRKIISKEIVKDVLQQHFNN